MAASAAMAIVDPDPDPDPDVASLYRTVEFRPPAEGVAPPVFSQMYTKQEGQVANVMHTIFQTLLDIHRHLYDAIMQNAKSDAIILELNKKLNEGFSGTDLEPLESPFIYFGTSRNKSEGVLYAFSDLLNKSSGSQRTGRSANAAPIIPDEQTGDGINLQRWFSGSSFTDGRTTLSTEEQAIFNSVIKFYVNLYKLSTNTIDPALLAILKQIILNNFTKIISACLAKGFSDSAIFLEAARQKFLENQELSVNLSESSDKIAAALASYIDGKSLCIRKTPKTQDAYILIMDKKILKFLVLITQKKIMSSDLSRLIQSLSFIDIVGESMIPSHSDKEGSTDKIYDVLVSIRNLKNQMQQELLHTQQFGNPEQILDFSFEELSEIYIELIMTQLPQNLRVNKPERQDFRSYITSLKNTISLDPRNPILIFAKIVSDYYVLLDYVGAIKFNFERLPPNFMDEAAAAKSDDTSFWSFLLVLFFTAYPNLKLPGDTFDNAQKRAIFTAFYDFLNAHDLKIKALFEVTKIVLPGFFDARELQLLGSVTEYHEDKQAINNFSIATGKVSILLNAVGWKRFFAYEDNDSLLNKPLREDHFRETPTLDLFTLIPCATRVTQFNDFKVGKEVAGPQLNYLKREIIKHIHYYTLGTQSESVLDVRSCVDELLNNTFFRILDAVTIASMYDSGSPPVFAAKIFINAGPNSVTISTSNGIEIRIKTTDTSLSSKSSLFFIEELIADIYKFSVEGTTDYPDVLIPTPEQKRILSDLPDDYQIWYDQLRLFLFLDLKTPGTNRLAVGKKKGFLLKLGKTINSQQFLNPDQLRRYTDLFNFFQSMQLLNDAVKPEFNPRQKRQEISDDKTKSLENKQKLIDRLNKQEMLLAIYTSKGADSENGINRLYADFFRSLFDAFLRAKNDVDQLNRLFSFISYFIENAPKTLAEVRSLPSNKSVIDITVRDKQQRLIGPSSQSEVITQNQASNRYGLGTNREVLTAALNTQSRGDIFSGKYKATLSSTFAPLSADNLKTPQSKLKRTNTAASLGGSRRRKHKKNKTKRRKHTYKYKKLTKRNCKKKYKTKKYNH